MFSLQENTPIPHFCRIARMGYCVILFCGLIFFHKLRRSKPHIFLELSAEEINIRIAAKGCNLRCAWCHNPESQSTQSQLLFYENKCTGCGKCKEKCPNSLKECNLCGKCALFCPNDAREICGKECTANEVLSILVKDKIFYSSSGGGVTFSGGECMLQIDELLELMKKCKDQGLHTALDTAGHVPYEYFERILPYTDLFLYDVKCMDSNKHKKYTGVENRLILENLKNLSDHLQSRQV